MSDKAFDQPLAIGGVSLDLHLNEQSCLYFFDVSAQEWLSRVNPYPDLEEFIKAFGSYLEKEKECAMVLPDVLLAAGVTLQSEDKGAILARLHSTLEARKSFWLIVGRGKAEKILSSAEPITAGSSRKASKDSNADVSNTQAVRPVGLNLHLLSIVIGQLCREREVDFHAVALEKGSLLSIHHFLEFHLADLYCRAELIVQTTTEEVNLRRQAEAPDVPFSEYSKRGQALIDLVHSEIEAVRPILRASLDEYRQVGLRPEQLWQFFQAEMTFIFENFPLIPYRFQKLLKNEFSLICFGPDRVIPVDDVPDCKAVQERGDAAFPVAITLSPLEGEAPDSDGNLTMDGKTGRDPFRPKTLRTITSPHECNPAQEPAHRNADRTTGDPIADERRAIYMSYKKECQERGIKMTRRILAALAKPTWNTFDPVKWWLANDSRSTHIADKLIRAVLKQKPHFPRG